jgi:hypothetical protein
MIDLVSQSEKFVLRMVEIEYDDGRREILSFSNADMEKYVSGERSGFMRVVRHNDYKICKYNPKAKTLFGKVRFVKRINWRSQKDLESIYIVMKTGEIDAMRAEAVNMRYVRHIRSVRVLAGIVFVGENFRITRRNVLKILNKHVDNNVIAVMGREVGHYVDEE